MFRRNSGIFFVGTRSIIAYRSSGSEPETRGARCRQHTDSDPDEHEQACDEYRIQNGILPFAGKGDYLFMTLIISIIHFAIGHKKARVLARACTDYFSLH